VGGKGSAESEEDRESGEGREEMVEKEVGDKGVQKALERK